MSIRYTSAYITVRGDTVASVVKQFGLSSPRALTEITPNRSIKAALESSAEMPAGLLIHIPPIAGELLRERIYAIDRFKPALLAHFAELHDRAEVELRAEILGSDPVDITVLGAPVGRLGDFVAESVDTILARTGTLVQICQAMVHTHIAEKRDFAVVNDGTDPYVGYYWAITPAIFGAWQNMWDESAWAGKLHGANSALAWEQVVQYVTTIGSVVVQQVDQRKREARAMQQQLMAER